MNMPNRLRPEKTTFINVGDTMIPISILPANIAQEFILIDRMKDEAAELTYRLEILSLAMKSKVQELGDSVSEHLAHNIQHEISNSSTANDINAS